MKPRPLFVANIPVSYGFFHGHLKRPHYLFAASKMARLLLSEHSRKVFETRVDPLVKFDKETFHSRYRLSKEVVLDLAEDFGRSRFASKGKGRGGGISNQLKVRVPVIYFIVLDQWMARNLPQIRVGMQSYSTWPIIIRTVTCCQCLVLSFLSTAYNIGLLSFEYKITVIHVFALPKFRRRVMSRMICRTAIGYSVV